MHIGSAGSKFENWIPISKKSILISIDGNFEESNLNQNFKKVIKSDSIISDKNGKAIFYITKDPHCSSLLKPNKKILKDWYFSHRFKIIKKKITKTTTINELIKKHNIKYIDWLVIDAQGIDLKILKSINKNILKNISIIDIEPGFFDFYYKSDKFYDVFKTMSKQFLFNDISFGYNYKVQSQNLSQIDKKILFLMNKKSKVYSNIIFFNKNKKIRNLIFRIFYLIYLKKFYEAKDLIILLKKKDIYFEAVYKKINSKINFQKIKLFLFYPFFLLKRCFVFK